MPERKGSLKFRNKWIRVLILTLAITSTIAVGVALGEWRAERRNARFDQPMDVAVDIAKPTLEPTPEPTPTPRQSAPAGRQLNPDGKMLALTFDDGPGAGTQRILKALESVGGRATFFVLGNRVEEHADVVRQVAAQGSEVATHTWSHKNLTKLSDEQIRTELKKGIGAVERTTGIRPRLLRPPYGSVNDRVRRIGGEMELVIANWNIDPEDWKVRNAKSVYQHIMKKAKDGGIVVCHDLYTETAQAIERAVVDLTRQGYQLVTVSELLEARAGGGEVGKLYYAG